jgi:uncharacterized protein (TIRG00374 family)
MDKKRTAITGIALAVLAALIYSQFRTWKNFDWDLFLAQTHNVSKFHILHGIALIYIAYVLRAVRWKIFLRPVRPDAQVRRLIAPTMMGFTGLALLGRPGELIRPYLIARRFNLPVSSQVAVWAVERIFDVGAFALLLGGYVLFAAGPKELRYYTQFRQGSLFLIGFVAVMFMGLAIVRWKGEAIADWVEARFSTFSVHFAHRVALRVREFRWGLNTIHGPGSLFLLTAASLLMWYIIVMAYQDVAHAYGVPVLDIQRSQVLILMGSSMLGSMIQLPGVGGGSQLATIAALEHIFGAPHELAASCGIMLWLVTFVAVVPAGLLLAHRERVSLRQLSAESQEAEESAASTPAA